MDSMDCVHTVFIQIEADLLSFRFKFPPASIRVILKTNRPKSKFHNASCREWPKCDKFKEFDQNSLLVGLL